MRDNEANRCPDHPHEQANYCRRCIQEAAPRPADFKQRYHQAVQEARAERDRLKKEATQP